MEKEKEKKRSVSDDELKNVSWGEKNGGQFSELVIADCTLRTSLSCAPCNKSDQVLDVTGMALCGTERLLLQSQEF